MTATSNPPAGFYEESGRQRWWDGTQWTSTYADEHAPQPGLGAKVGGLIKDRAKSVTSGVTSSASSAASEVKQNVANAGSAVRAAATDTDVQSTSVNGDPAVPLYEVVSHIEGKNAKVRLWPDRLEWERPRGISRAKITAGVLTGGASLFLTGVKGGKDAYEMIPLRQITSVGNRKDGMLYHLVEVQSAGGTVGFRVSRDDAARFRQAIMDQLNARENAPAIVQLAVPAAAPAADPVAQIKQLAELRDSGILTEDEFAAKKAEILSRM
jgi:Short C-terminal domain/Protein of unknown function (DUF2510)